MLQDAIKHNSYMTEERKIEKGAIEEGFKSADEIIEGSSYMQCIRQGRRVMLVQNLFPASG